MSGDINVNDIQAEIALWKNRAWVANEHARIWKERSEQQDRDNILAIPWWLAMASVVMAGSLGYLLGLSQ